MDILNLGITGGDQCLGFADIEDSGVIADTQHDIPGLDKPSRDARNQSELSEIRTGGHNRLPILGSVLIHPLHNF